MEGLEMDKLVEYLRQNHPEIFKELIFREDGVYITVKGVELFKKHIREILDILDC